MKKTFILSVFIVLTLALTACTAKDDAKTPAAPETDTPVSAAPEEPADASPEAPADTTPEAPADTEPETPAVKAIVSADYADDALLSKADTFDEFIDDDSEYQVKVVFTANTAVKDFKFVALNYKEGASADGETSFEIAEELYSAETLSPERPLVVGTLLDGTIPNRGISFVDETGATRTFSISTSGEDNSILLVEFK